MEKKHQSGIFRGTKLNSGTPDNVQKSPDSQIKWELEKMTKLEQTSSCVVATVDDYEADRKLDQKRIEQLLQDTEETLNRLEVQGREESHQLHTVQNTQTGLLTHRGLPHIPVPGSAQASNSPLYADHEILHVLVDPGSQKPQTINLLSSSRIQSPSKQNPTSHLPVADSQKGLQIRCIAQRVIPPQTPQKMQQRPHNAPQSVSSQSLNMNDSPQALQAGSDTQSSCINSQIFPVGMTQPISTLPLSALTMPDQFGEIPTSNLIHCTMQIDGDPAKYGMVLPRPAQTSTGSVQYGSLVRFVPPRGYDTMISTNGKEQNVLTMYQCISAMKEYESQSLEELQFEDYLAGRRIHFFGQKLDFNIPVSVFPINLQRPNLSPGTIVKFVPVSGQDTMVKNGVTQNINTEHQCITAMGAYEKWSLEELRAADYLANRKVSSTKLFCDNCRSMEDPTDMIQCCEGHLLCSSCVKIAATNISRRRINCLLHYCDSDIPRSQVEKILPEILYSQRDEDWENKWLSEEESRKSFSGAYVTVEIEKTEPEFECVSSLFYHSMYHKKGSFSVRKVYRIQNQRLWEKYDLTKKHMVKDLSEEQINERRLFHGTSTKVVPNICEEGFDWRRCGVKNGTKYGKGAYFARDATFSHGYVDTSGKNILLKPSISIPSGSHLMFVVKVLVGNTFQGESSTARPPKNKHTAVNSMTDPSIFVVFDFPQSYPEYLIEYIKQDS